MGITDEAAVGKKSVVFSASLWLRQPCAAVKMRSNVVVQRHTHSTYCTNKF